MEIMVSFTLIYLGGVAAFLVLGAVGLLLLVFELFKSLSKILKKPQH